MNRKQRRTAAKLEQSTVSRGQLTGAAGSSAATELFDAGLKSHRAGRLLEAESYYRQALSAYPAHAEACSNLGIALQMQGKVEDAVVAFRRAADIKPNFAEAYYNLGKALKEQGKLVEAITAYGCAIGCRPDYAEAYCNLGNALLGCSRPDEAIDSYRQAIRIKPGFSEAQYNLGNALAGRGKLHEAAVAYQSAFGFTPNYAEAYVGFGDVLADQGRLDEAAFAYRKAISIRSNYAAAYSALGSALVNRGKVEEAVIACRRAIEIDPEYAQAYTNLGIALSDQGKIDEAVTASFQAINIKPDNPLFHSHLLFCMNYHDKLTLEQVFVAHQEWNRQFGRVSISAVYPNDRDAERRLKIGFVSADLRQHSVAYFIEPLLRSHNRDAVEVYCYSDALRPDAVTTRLREYADHWRMTLGLTDNELLDSIRTDAVDILIDLAGHTAGNRLGVFARKPAPLQLTWLGYPNTTGLQSIDYRIVDSITDPPGESDAFASEVLLRLEDGFLCYDAPTDAPEPTAPPCLECGTTTFGSFNTAVKLSESTLAAWAAVLHRLPRARLLLKGPQFADEDTRLLFLSRLSNYGVEPERVELLARLPSIAAHLSLYQRVDVALDPFPYNGTTTTCEALWMGVPVVTLCGDRHAGRVGASLLGQVDMAELIASTVEEYVDIAVALAGDPARLNGLRRTLRPRLMASPLCDSDGFARKFERALRHIWRLWCKDADREKQGIKQE